MSDQLFKALEAKLDQLIVECSRLSRDNSALQRQLAESKQRESDWHHERKRLIDKNELAKSRIEAMIARLKNLEQN